MKIDSNRVTSTTYVWDFPFRFETLLRNLMFSTLDGVFDFTTGIKNRGSGLIKNARNSYTSPLFAWWLVGWSKMPFPSLAIVCLPSSDSHSLCLFRCKCHPERGKKEGTQLWGLGFDSKSLLFSPLFFFFPTSSPVQTGRTEFRPALYCACVCVYLCGIDLTSKPPREESFFLSTEKHTEIKRVEMVESVTRANRITLYFPPDEGGGIVVWGRLKEKKVGWVSRKGGLVKRTNSWRRARNAQRNQRQSLSAPVYIHERWEMHPRACVRMCVCVWGVSFYFHSTSLHHVPFFLSLFVMCVFFFFVFGKDWRPVLGALCTRRHRQSFYTHADDSVFIGWSHPINLPTAFCPRTTTKRRRKRMLTSSLIERQPVPMCNVTFKVRKEKSLSLSPSKTAPNLGISGSSNFVFQQTNANSNFL